MGKVIQFDAQRDKISAARCGRAALSSLPGQPQQRELITPGFIVALAMAITIGSFYAY